VVSSGNDSNASVNYSSLDLFFNGQPVPQTPTAALSSSEAETGGTLGVTGGTNWWGSSDGAPNSGPYGDTQSGTFYQVTAPGVYVGTSRSTAVPVVNSTVTIPANTYVCTGAESTSVGPNPCTMTPGQPTGSFQLPSNLSPGNYNIYIDESNTTPLVGNGPNDAYQTTTGHTLGTVESTTPITIGTAPSITSGNATTFTVGSAGSFSVTTSETPNAALSETGSLPRGVTFADDGNGTAALAGTPAAGTGGSYPITITANNGLSPNATQSFTLTVDQAPAVTSANHTTFTAGSAGSFSVTTSGTPTAALSETGSLPRGVTFADDGNGTAALAGTPAGGSGGSYPITITASNGVSPNASQSFTLTVDQSPAITSSAGATFTVGSAGSFSITTTGIPNAALSKNGTLPSGVSFVDNGNGTATLAGTPAAGSGGSYPITITASNGVSPNASQSFTLTVDQSPVITSGTAISFVEGSSGTFTVTSTGFPTAALSEVGSLPSGVTFVDNGNGTATLAGTPGAATRGTYPITITAANGVSPNGSQSFTLTVNAAPTITSANTTTFTVGSAGTFTVTTSGNPTSALSETGTLPAGVTFVNNGDGTATLSGTPAVGTGGNYPITVKAANGVSPNGSQSFTLVVDQAPAVTSTAGTTFADGVSSNFEVTTSGFPTAAVSETGSLPIGVSFVDNGNGTATLSGTPTSGGTFPITITASNGVGANASQSFVLTVTTVSQAPSVTSVNGTTFTFGSANSFTVASTGTPTPSLSENGTLPSGVTFVDNGDGTASLSGTPASNGTYPITIRATNGVSPNASQSFTLTVDQAPAITSANSTSFVEGSSNSFTVRNSAFPTPSLSETGTLPGGVSFVDNGDGTATLSGDPSASGSFTFTIKASNGVSPTATQSFTLTVDFAPAITSASSATFTVGSSGSFTVTSTGNPTSTIAEAGSLPSGVSFAAHANGTATLSGTPAAGTGGTYPITITATNGISPQASQSFTLTVDQPPAITSANSASFVEGSSNTFTVTTSAFPTPALSENGTLPSGVSFVDNGDGTAALSGNPTAGTQGSYTFTIKASNGVSPNATQSFTLTVEDAPAITSASSATFTVGSSGSFTVTSTGNPTSTIAEPGSLPSGVSFAAHANGTATLSGTPAAGTGGTYPITITATNGISPQASQSFTLTVDQPPAITSANSASFVEGSSNSFTVSTSGFPTAALSETGTLPGGVSFVDNGDGTATLSGDPTAGGSFPITIKASNGVSPTASQSFTLTVGTAPTITSASSATFAVGSAGSFTVTATGNPTPTITASGTLPAGVTFSGNKLSGTPTKAGTFQIGFVANNGISPQAVQYFTLTVTGLHITTATLPAGTKGVSYSSTLKTAGGTGPYAWKITTGALPTGLKLNSSTGKVSGKPTRTGKTTFKVQVQDSSKPTKQTATATFTLTINA
jgi:hypothetical protein